MRRRKEVCPKLFVDTRLIKGVSRSEFLIGYET